jgi:hypothetical protein
VVASPIFIYDVQVPWSSCVFQVQWQRSCSLAAARVAERCTVWCLLACLTNLDTCSLWATSRDSHEGLGCDSEGMRAYD